MEAHLVALRHVDLEGRWETLRHDETCLGALNTPCALISIGSTALDLVFRAGQTSNGVGLFQPCKVTAEVSPASRRRRSSKNLSSPVDGEAKHGFLKQHVMSRGDSVNTRGINLILRDKLYWYLNAHHAR